MIAKREQSRERIQAEGGGWVTLYREAPELQGKTSAELLEFARTLPGSLRPVAIGDGVELVGEIRSDGGSATFDEARQRLQRWLEPTLTDEPVTPEALEAALDSSGFAWTRREQNWAIAAGSTTPREIVLHLEPDGVRLEAVLCDWDAIDDVGQTALTEFLLAAQETLRGVRFHLDANRAVAVARADANHLDADVLHGLHAVANACRSMIREAAALLTPTVARGYLAVREIRGVPSR